MRLLTSACVALLMAGCPGRENVPCGEDTDCDLSTGGVCTAAASGNKWCAYPDPECPSGYRYSDVDVGDDVGGVCTIQQTFTLTVAVGGNSPGTVSDADGFTCETGSCEQMFPAGAQVELLASTTTGAFLGWSDACNGFTSCVVTMDGDKLVGALFGEPGQALWVQHGGSTTNDLARAIARDTDNYVVIAGEFRGAIQLGGSNLTSAGGSDVFVAKLETATGNVVWAKQYGGTGDDVANAVAVDDTSNVYLAGTFNGTIDFGGGPLQSPGGLEAFAAKLDASGNYAWAQRVGGASFDAGRSIAVRGSSVVFVGNYQGSMTVDGMPKTSAGVTDIFIISFTTAGAFQWVKTYGGTGTDDPAGVTIDDSANVVVAGRFSNTTNLGGGNLVSAGFDDIFVAKYAGNTGAHLFSKRFGSTGFDGANAVATDPSENILLLGAYVGTVDFGGPSPLTASGTSTFLAKYSLAGAFSWAKSFGDAIGEVVGSSVTTNPAGDVAITGNFCGTTSFGGRTFSSVRSCADFDQDIYAVRFSGSDGGHMNSTRAGGTALDVAYGVTQLTDGRFFVAGAFQGFAEFGGQGVMSNGEYDIVTLGLAPL